jgi:hypothetical protein
MEREISSGAMLGIVLLALAAVIGLGFGVFAIAKGVANEGTVNVQDSLGTVSSQVFLDYDQKIVSGQQAVSGLKTFEGKPYAVLVQTKALINGRAVASDRKTVNLVATATPKEVFVNYNALIAGAKGVDTAGKATGAAVDYTSGTNLMTLTNGSYIIADGFVASSGNVTLDNNTGGVFKSGNAEYIPTSTKFQANLIKDISGNIMGYQTHAFTCMGFFMKSDRYC